jgi:hypothetical protein
MKLLAEKTLCVIVEWTPFVRVLCLNRLRAFREGADGSDTCEGIDEVQFQLTIKLLRLLRNMCAAGAECQVCVSPSNILLSVTQLLYALSRKHRAIAETQSYDRKKCNQVCVTARLSTAYVWPAIL